MSGEDLHSLISHRILEEIKDLYYQIKILKETNAQLDSELDVMKLEVEKKKKLEIELAEI